MLRDGFTKQHQLSIAGAKDKFKYYLSLNISNNKGVIYGSYWNKIGGRLNIDYSVNDWCKIGTNIGVTTSKEKGIRELFNGQAAYTSSLLLNAYEPLRNTDGTYNYTSLGQNAMETTDNNPNISSKISNFATLFTEIRPIRNLTLKSQLGINYNVLSQEYYLQPGSYLALTLGYNQKRDNGNNDFLYVFTNTANWQQSLNNKHNLNFIAGTEFTKDKFYGYSMTSRGLPTASVNTLDNGSTPTQATTSRTDWALISYFANFGYNFQQKYYLTVSGRRDGSSRFGANARFANFGAISAAWDIYNDVIKKGTVINLLKARASFGLDGNNSGIGNYQALGTYALNVNYNNQPASSPNSIANPDLTWEKSQKSDFAIEYGLLGNRITGSVDLYSRQTKSLIYNVNLSNTTGFSSYVGNIGGLQNSGIELALSVDVIKKKDWTWNISASYTNNQNKVTQLYKDSVVAGNTGSLAWFVIGQPIFTYKLVKYDAVDPSTGKNMYVNLDGTKSANYSSSQAQLLNGKSNQVKYFGSINTSIRYRDFDLAAQFYYSGGNYIMNYVYQTGASDGESINNNQFTIALDYWKKPGDKSKYANLNDPSQRATFDIDRYLEKGDYVSLRNLTIGYQVPEIVLKKLQLKGFRVFMEGTNLLMLTKFHGLPEVGEANGESTGVVGGTYALYGYPQFKSFAFGINCKL
jgi:TonB-linked SusC/RagA family outer membrane protein